MLPIEGHIIAATRALEAARVWADAANFYAAYTQGHRDRTEQPPERWDAPTMIWLLIGAVLGCLHFLLFMRRSLPQGHLPKDLALAGFLGALIYGSLLLLAARMFF